MGAFSIKKKLYGNPVEIPSIAEQIRNEFVTEGYEVRIENSGSTTGVYITKGGLFKAIVGLKSALKVTMKPSRDGSIDFYAGVSVVKQQLLSTIVTVCLFSPVVITQIWGVIKQAKLDEKAVEIAERVLYKK